MSFDLKLLNGDIAIAPDGTLVLSSGNDKLRQDILKIILTKLGEDRYNQKYGTYIGATEIGGVQDFEFIQLDVESSVRDALVYLVELQNAQSRSQYLTSDEKILSINSIEVANDQLDPRLLNIFISITTEKLTTFTDSITIKLI